MSPKNPKDRIALLYPFVNEAETPLPRAWSNQDKCNYIGLSQNNLRAHYKGKFDILNFNIPGVNEIEILLILYKLPKEII